MVCIQSIMGVSKGINTTQSQYTQGNSNIEIGTKERNDWGNLGDDQVSYGNIW